MNLRTFFGLCEHKWKIIGGNSKLREDDTKVGTIYHLQCEKCGTITSNYVGV